MRTPEPERTVDVLRSLREEPVEAELAEVRERVMTQVERRKPSWVWGLRWQRALVPAAAAVVLVSAWSLRVLFAPAPVHPALPVLELAVPKVAEAKAARAPAYRAAPSGAVAPGPVEDPVPVAQEPLLVKLFTDDPDVVIYWLMDGEGDSL